jgi:hypothetical protein
LTTILRDKIYLTSQDCDVYVIRAGPTYELLATNSMGDICEATPALLKDEMVVRTRSALYALEECVDGKQLGLQAGRP